MALSLVLIWFMSANLQIQTNVENAVQTIKKIFVTNDGLMSEGTNTLVSINADNNGKVYIKNALETSGSVVLNGIPVYNNPVDYKILTIGANNTVYKTDPAIFGSGGWTPSNQWTETISTLTTNKQVWIGESPVDESLRVLGNSTFGSWGNRIYLFPNNAIWVGLGGITSYENNLKINTKASWILYLNYDVSNADTAIANNGKTNIMFKSSGNMGIDIVSPTSRLDISNWAAPYNQLRIRDSYTPWSTADINGNTWDIVRDNNYIYIKTTNWRKRTTLETFWPAS